MTKLPDDCRVAYISTDEGHMTTLFNLYTLRRCVHLIGDFITNMHDEVIKSVA